MIRVLRAADRVATPWKNGGGVTREVAVWPAGAGFDDFQWRVSMAQVRADGPFSAFPGVDRVLAVLEGRLRLEVEGRPPVTLGRGDRPAAFPGDVPTKGIVEAGPVLDLNIMTRRGRVRPVLARMDTATTLEPAQAMRMVVAVGDVQVAGVSLATYDAVLIEAGAPRASLAPAAGAFAYVASFEAA